jgi:hypothetical protein
LLVSIRPQLHLHRNLKLIVAALFGPHTDHARKVNSAVKSDKYIRVHRCPHTEEEYSNIQRTFAEISSLYKAPQIKSGRTSAIPERRYTNYPRQKPVCWCFDMIRCETPKEETSLIWICETPSLDTLIDKSFEMYNIGQVKISFAIFTQCLSYQQFSECYGFTSDVLEDAIIAD